MLASSEGGSCQHSPPRAKKGSTCVSQELKLEKDHFAEADIELEERTESERETEGVSDIQGEGREE